VARVSRMRMPNGNDAIESIVLLQNV
jgi:hypothetical protein